MSETVTLALFGIVPLAVLLAGTFAPRTAILSTLVIGWMFLPVAKIPVVGIPDYDKIVAANFAMFLGCLLFDGRRLFSLRLRWYDVPMLMWCLAPGLSSLTNDLGAYDAFSAVVRQVLMWFLPYWIGRTHFNDAEGMRRLALAVVIGALVYVPFCLLEVRISPQLNNMVYGFHQNQFWRNVRFDGYRPVVFMQSGLMVGTWMAAATVAAFWSWRTGQRPPMGAPWSAICAVLFVTTVLCKALYAILLMFVALALLGAVNLFRTRAPLILLMLCVPAYMIVRSTQVVPASVLTRPAAALFGADRGQSLEARLVQEDVLVRHVAERPLFGWGGWRRSWPIDVYTEEYELRGIDGLWTIALGENGLFGLFTLFATLLLPVGRILFQFKPQSLNLPVNGPMTAMAVCLLLFACDCLLNGMFNPLYLLTAGGLVGFQAGEQVDVAPLQVATTAPTMVPRRLRWYGI